MATSDSPLSVPDVTLAVARGAGNTPIVTDWQLPATNYVAAKRPLQIIQPHPTQIGSDSIYLWAEPGERYEVPICAIFGAYPYHFAVDGPDGMTVGSFLVLDSDGVTLIRPDSYGVVSFDVPLTGMTSFSYTVTVTDQQLNTQSVTVNVTVDASKFVHLAPLGQGVGDGSAGNPLGSFRDVWKDDYYDSTYAGKILRLHGGNYTLYGDPINDNTNVKFDGARKPKVWIAKAGETPVFDCSQAKILFNGGSMDDCAFAGIRFENARTDISNAHFFWATMGMHRQLFWRNHFENLGTGSIANDNWACIFIPADGANGCVIKDNTANNVDGPMYDTYNTIECLFEGNEVSNSAANQTHFLKGRAERCCVRHEKAIDGISGEQAFDFYLAATGGIQSAENEFCYNVASSNWAARLSWSSTGTNPSDQWFYRNTIHGVLRHGNTDTADWTHEKNVFSENVPSGDGLTLVDNQLAAPTDIVDGKLTGAALSLAGQYGAQISKEVS